MRRTKTAAGIAAVLGTMAIAGPATAGSTTATLKEVSGVDHGDGTATITGSLKGSSDCRKGRKVSLRAGAGPGAAPFKFGDDKTTKKGKFSMRGKMPDAVQRLTFSTKEKGSCMTPYAILRFDEVFEPTR